jgi:uncharacterized membrane protein YsdA (DUF1294 family)
MMISIAGFTFFLLVLCTVNLAVFVIFARDKHAARKNTRRTSERTLVFLALFGPFGAYGAMKIYRHKTRKIIFYVVPVFLILHLAGIIYGVVVIFR